jgi:hypothetical protein
VTPRAGRAERRATDLQRRLRAAHQHLGVPPLASHTDLAVAVQALAPLGSLS